MAILRSLYDSPIAIIISIIFWTFLTIAFFYSLFQVNLYLLHTQIIPNFNGPDNADVILWIIIEFLFSVILLFFGFAISETLVKINADIEKFEMDLVEWRK